MKATIGILAGFAIVALSACAGGGSGNSDGSQANMNGKPAGDYYAQFQISGSPASICAGHETENLTVKTVANAHMRIYLFSTGLAHVVMSNRSIANYNWSVQGTDLVIAGQHFSGINSNGEEALTLASGEELYKSDGPWSCVLGTATPW